MIEKERNSGSFEKNGQNKRNHRNNKHNPTDQYIPTDEHVDENNDVNYGEGKYIQLYSRLQYSLGLTKDETRDLIDGIE